MQRLVASFFSLLVLIGISAIPAHAQIDGSTNTDPFSVSTSPDYPAPYQTVTVTPSGDSFDIAGATITVSVNGTSIYKGSGGQSIPVTVGGPGTVANITVTASAGGQTYSKKLSIRPASVALVVEPETTTHPFYQGRPLITEQSQVRLIAVPDIRTSANSAVSPSSLVYTWKLGDQILESASGIGKSVLEATAPQQYRDAAITVIVSTQDGSITAQTSTTVSPTTPLVRIYRNDPLMGPLFDTALSGSVTMDNAEETYRAVPYYFTTTPLLGWTVNGVESGSDPDITVRSSGSGQGTAVLGLTAQQQDPLASAATTVSLLFGQKGAFSIFGL